MEILREKRPEGPVDKSGSKDFSIRGFAFALHESARESSRRSEFLLVVNLKRHEVHIFLGILCACDAGEEHRAPHFHDYRSVGLLGQLACFDFDCPSVGQFDFFVDNIHECLPDLPPPMGVD